MRKIISIFLALCMMMCVLPVLAEDATETEGLGSLLSLFSDLGSEEGNTGDGEGLGSLLSLFGDLGSEEGNTGDTEGLGSLLSLFGDLGGEESTGDGEGLGSLLGLFGNLGGEEGTGETEGFNMNVILGQLGISAATEETYVAAESVEQFFGTWQLSQAVAAGYAMSPEALKTLGLDFSLILTISADGIEMKTNDAEPVNVPVTDCELADGILVMKVEGENAQLRLTESGELCYSMGKSGTEGFEMHFVPVN